MTDKNLTEIVTIIDRSGVEGGSTAELIPSSSSFDCLIKGGQTLYHKLG